MVQLEAEAYAVEVPAVVDARNARGASNEIHVVLRDNCKSPMSGRKRTSAVDADRVMAPYNGGDHEPASARADVLALADANGAVGDVPAATAAAERNGAEPRRATRVRAKSGPDGNETPPAPPSHCHAAGAPIAAVAALDDSGVVAATAPHAAAIEVLEAEARVLRSAPICQDHALRTVSCNCEFDCQHTA